MTICHQYKTRYVGNIRDRDSPPGFAVRYIQRGGAQFAVNGAATTSDNSAGAGSNRKEQPMKRNSSAKARQPDAAPRFASQQRIAAD